jgi:hypothetical protein
MKEYTFGERERLRRGNFSRNQNSVVEANSCLLPSKQNYIKNLPVFCLNFNYWLRS